jgi:putative hydrolase of the HAD superfamily
MANFHNKYLIWDFEGTLAWRPGGWAGAVVSVLRRYHPEIEISPEKIRAYLQSGFPWHAPENAHPGLSPSEWWEDLQPVLARAFRSAGVQNGDSLKMAQDVRTVYLDPLSWQRYNDSLPVLEILSAKGWQHVLLSNNVPELPILLERLGLASYFIRLFNSAETGYEKPNPKAFRMVLDWIGPDSTVWMIGDNFGCDVLGGLEVGLPGILVRKPHPDAPIYCATLHEIPERI